MDLKDLFQQMSKKIKSTINTGKIQRVFRITYDSIWNIILFFIIIGFIGLFFASGVGAGYFASLVKDEPIHPYDSMENAIYNYEETSKLYFANNKLLGDIRADLHRENTTLDKVSDTLINAVVATEDEYFTEHPGVVPKAIVRAVFQEATNASIKTGGSTLTQQLIKNQMLTNEVSFDRKAKEILLALRLERFFEKDEILEAYLNIIPYGREASGRNIAGVQTAAKGIFNIDADEVNLAQAAYLAGLPQSPSAYTPFINTGGLKDEEGLQPGLNRMKSVLKRMYDANYISKKEYEEALEYDIVADLSDKTDSPMGKYGYLSNELQERATTILKKKLLEEDGITKEDLEEDKSLDEQYHILAERDLRMNGYNIHSTIDKKIYDKMQEVVKNYPHFGPERTNPAGEVKPVETGGMLIENSTGKIISFIGGRDFNENENNHATNTYRQNGSTIKAILTYPAAMEKGYVQPGTPIADIPTNYSSGDRGPISNYSGRNYGIVPARRAFASSYNIPAVKTYQKVLHENPVKEYFDDKMKFNKLEESDYVIESMALGSMRTGVSIEENTNAFAMIGNNGQFVDAYMIEKITTQDGEVIYEHESEPVDIYSPQTAYLTIDMMRDVISGGTGVFLNSQLTHTGIDWAGKTGTTNDYKDAWFVGTNPNVTLGTWIGYDDNMGLDYCPGCSLTYSQRNLKLWAELINNITDINPDLLAPNKRFERPDGIVERSFCAISGMLPSELCSKAGLVQSDLFNANFVPTEKDDSLISGSYIMVDGKAVVAGPNTPKEFVEGNGLSFNPDFLKRMGYNKLSDITQLFPDINRELWERITVPGDDLGGELKNDGKQPAPPKSVNISKKTLSWNKSDSKNIVGYRVFRADGESKKFKLIGHTTGTNFSIPGSEGIYYVKAVNYFGLESSSSKEVGELHIVKDEKDKKKEKSKEEKEKEKEKSKEEKKKKKEKENEMEKEEEKEEENEEDEQDK